MIIGANKDKVINNIKNAVKEKNFNVKVEVDDPNLTPEQKDEIISNYINKQSKLLYKISNGFSNFIISFFTWLVNKDTKIKGLENIKDIKTGAIITSNHFNPLDNTIIRKFARETGKKKLYIVGQETNLAMPGIIGFLMNHCYIIPITDRISYMKKTFPETLNKRLSKNDFILIYPEQEMWFNYRKPRPPKPGAYYYAAQNNVPVISCFVEIIDTKEKETEEFNKTKYILHILPTIYPDSTKTVKENTAWMMEQDYKQKKTAYEEAYNKKLNYDFEKEDIAGLR